jgi:hypothetical protein
VNRGSVVASNVAGLERFSLQFITVDESSKISQLLWNDSSAVFGTVGVSVSFVCR